MATLLSMRTQVRDDLDLDDDLFITNNDIRTWLNMAIRVAESNIHTLYEDYYLANATIPIYFGTNEYDYPVDIFANKIRSVVFKLGTIESHIVRPVTRLAETTAIDSLVTSVSNPTLTYKPINNAGGRKIRIYPTTCRDGSLDIWYIRNARLLVDDTDETDIDEFSDYLVQFAKTRALMKDGDSSFQLSKALEEEMKTLMIETLSDMTPDQNNILHMDTSSYEEQGE